MSTAVTSNNKRSSIAGADSVSSNEPKQKRLRLTGTPVPSPPTTSVIGIDLFSYFRKLSLDSDFDAIFKDRVVVLALFRSLDNIERIIVLRILSLPEPSRWEPFLFWLGGNRKEVIRALNSLCSLHILLIRPQKTQPSSLTGSQQQSSSGIRRSSTDDGNSGVDGSSSVLSTASKLKTTSGGVAGARYELHQVFKRTLWNALHNASFDPMTSIPSTIHSSKHAKHFPTKETLHWHAASKWNNVLRFLCEGSTMNRQPSDSSTAQYKSLMRFHQQQLFSSAKPFSCSPDLLVVLKRLRVLTSNKDDNSARTSPDGLPNDTFQWLLLDIRLQILSILIEYLYCVHFNIFGDSSGVAVSMQDPSIVLESSTPATAEKASKDRTEILCVLFALSELPIGQPCAVNPLTPIQIRFLSLAYDIGLIWMHKPKEAKHYFPTPFAKLLQCDGPEMMHLTSAISSMTTLENGTPDNSFISSPLVIELPSYMYHSSYSKLSSGHDRKSADCQLNELNAGIQTPLAPAVKKSSARESGIVVESNFKLFAHIASSLLVTVIARLCDIRVITPNLVIGTLSRDKFLDVYKSGVTADQIIRFLTTHAHPSIYAKSQRDDKGVIPENVITQLKIWESERRRVRISNACVFEFSKESDLDFFPLSVTKATSAKWILMNTEIPSSSNPSSKEEWKAKAVQRFKERPPNGELQKTPFAVLAVRAQHKDEMTAFIRSSIRSFKR